jgi:hypothetical protein
MAALIALTDTAPVALRRPVRGLLCDHREAGGCVPAGTQAGATTNRVSVVSVVSADSEPRPVLADDLLKLGGVLRQARNIPDQHEIRDASCDVRQDLPAPT